MADALRRRVPMLAQLIGERRWLLTAANVAASALFVAGCVGFYQPTWYLPAVTPFLIGSVLFLISALGAALVEHAPEPEERVR